MKVCSQPRCPTLVPRGTSRCADCAREADRARGNFKQRGYGGPAWERARAVVLRRDRACVLCGAPANVADHYPEGRDDLVARGVTDPDAPHRMRGLCRSCHSKETARNQPGGWNDRD